MYPLYHINVSFIVIKLYKESNEFLEARKQEDKSDKTIITMNHSEGSRVQAWIKW